MRASVTGALLAALALTGCASDVVLKPQANAFNQDANEAIATVGKGYADLATSYNALTIDRLADNPGCGFKTTLRIRTAKADEWLKANATAKGFPLTGLCLSEGEWALLDDASQTRLAETEKLIILGRNDFAAQFAAIEELADYVALLAEFSDAPTLELKAQIGETANALRGLAGSLSATDAAVRTGEATTNPLFANGGPVDEFAKGVGDLAEAIEVIVKQEQDAKAIRAAVLGPQGARITPLIGKIARDADRWACVQFNVNRLGALLDERKLEKALPTMSRDERVKVFRKFIEGQAAQPARTCGTSASKTLPPPSPAGRMLAELAHTHDELRRIANGRYTKRERRIMATAALNRLAAVFRAVAKTAAVVI